MEHKAGFSYRGYPIEDIAKNSSYEEASYLLLNGKLPTKSELEDFSAKLKAERELPDKIINLIIESASKSDPMDILRTAVSYLSIYDGDTKTQTKEANIKKSNKTNLKNLKHSRNYRCSHEWQRLHKTRFVP